MSLAGKIRDVLEISDISNQTREIALKEIIEAYRNHVVAMKESKRLKNYNPSIERVIAGETTYKKEFKKNGSAKFMNTGNLDITGGNYEMEKSIKLVDQTIKRLYLT